MADAGGAEKPSLTLIPDVENNKFENRESVPILGHVHLDSGILGAPLASHESAIVPGGTLSLSLGAESCYQFRAYLKNGAGAPIKATVGLYFRPSAVAASPASGTDPAWLCYDEPVLQRRLRRGQRVMNFLNDDAAVTLFVSVTRMI